MATVRKRGRPAGTAKQSESAKKAKRRESDRERSREKIFIGNYLERWNTVKGELNLMFNHEVAGYLLDRYEAEHEALKAVCVVSSTPRAAGQLVRIPQGISDISSDESGKRATDIAIGIEELDSGPGPSTSKRAKGKLASSFVDPLELSIDITEESEDEDQDVSEYRPSFNIYP